MQRYKFSGYNKQAWHGWGTEEQAKICCDIHNQNMISLNAAKGFMTQATDLYGYWLAEDQTECHEDVNLDEMIAAYEQDYEPPSDIIEVKYYEYKNNPTYKNYQQIPDSYNKEYKTIKLYKPKPVKEMVITEDITLGDYLEWIEAQDYHKGLFAKRLGNTRQLSRLGQKKLNDTDTFKAGTKDKLISFFNNTDFTKLAYQYYPRNDSCGKVFVDTSAPACNLDIDDQELFKLIICPEYVQEVFDRTVLSPQQILQAYPGIDDYQKNKLLKGFDKNVKITKIFNRG